MPREVLVFFVTQKSTLEINIEEESGHQHRHNGAVCDPLRERWRVARHTIINLANKSIKIQRQHRHDLSDLHADKRKMFINGSVDSV